MSDETTPGVTPSSSPTAHAEELTPRQRFWREPSTYVALAVAVVGGVFVFSQTPRPCDDAYITFRHVKNLTGHGTLSWNLQGPQVLGTSAPAYAVLLAIWSLLTFNHDIPSAALLLNSLLHAGTILLAYACARDLGAGRLGALLTAAIIASHSVVVNVASLGFENPLLTCLLLASFLAARRKRWEGALVLISVAPLVRPEGMLGALIVWGSLLAQRSFRVIHLLYFGIVPILWILYSMNHYGSPVPQSVMAKRFFPLMYEPYNGEAVNLLGRAWHLPENALDAIRTWAIRVVVNAYGSAMLPKLIRFLVGVAFFAPVFVTLVYYARRHPKQLVYLTYPFLFGVFYATIGSTQSWYFPSYIVFAILLIYTAPAAAIREVLLQRGKSPKLDRRKRSYTVGVVLAAIALIATNRFSLHRGDPNEERPWLYAVDGNPWDRSFAEIERYRSYRKAAELLNAEPDADSKTALISEVGVFGYYFNGNVYDAVGLCSPSAPGYYPPPDSDRFASSGKPYPAANNIVPTEMIIDVRPDYVVNAKNYIPHLLEPGKLLQTDYTQIGETGTAWRSTVMVFAKKPEE